MNHSDATTVHKGAYVGATDPALEPANNVLADKLWVDTSGSSPVFKLRNVANDGWIDFAAGGAIYTVYTAILSQAGSGDPTATVQENTLIGNIVWTRDAVGTYRGTLAGGFPGARTLIFPKHNTNLVQDTGVNFFYSDPDHIEVFSYVPSTEALADDIINQIYVEIRVYPEITT